MSHQSTQSGKTSLVRVALIAAPEPDVHWVARELRQAHVAHRFELREFHSLAEANRYLRFYPFDVLVLRHQRFAKEAMRALALLRERFPQSSLLSLVREHEPSAVYEAGRIARHKFIYEASEKSDLAHAALSLTEGEASRARLHPRVARKGEAEILLLSSDGLSVRQQFRARFLDFSSMGAQLALTADGRVRAGGRARLHYISSSDPSRLKRIETKIVWVSSRQPAHEATLGQRLSYLAGTSSPEQRLALRFIAAY